MLMIGLSVPVSMMRFDRQVLAHFVACPGQRVQNFLKVSSWLILFLKSGAVGTRRPDCEHIVQTTSFL